nr:cupin domain-containing protein [uncultured Halomonas sp.]
MQQDKNVNFIDESEAAALLTSLPDPFAVLFERGDVSVELFSPRGVDTQTPHAQDEIYIISSGHGTFHLEDELFDFEQGDFFFVPAGAEHRFTEFSDDFRTWVIFFGPVLARHSQS